MLNELERRAARDRPGSSTQLDLTRIALAGFNFGALPVMITASEDQQILTADALPLLFRPVITFRPYACVSGAPFDKR